MSPPNSNQCVVERGVVSPPATSAHHIPVASHALRMGYVETAGLETLLKASPCKILGIVHHERSLRDPGSFDDCPVVCLDLPQFGGPPLAEVWTSTLPVTYGQAAGIHYAMNDEVLFGALQLEESPGTLLDSVTYRAYHRLLVQARALGYPHLLRMWNYFPHINSKSKSDGLERYQRFCAGRHQALAEGLPDFPRSLPAATAVGTRSGPLKIHFLSATQPGTHLENPRQVRAYEYPRIYGPRSPSFARATLRSSISGSHLLIAGTASVVGHMSEHIDEPQKQTMEIIHNLNALMTRTEKFHGGDGSQWSGQALFKVYIRHSEHVAAVREILKGQLPSDAQVLYLQGDMCRNELFLEIEGILAQKETIDVSQPLSPTPVRPRQPMVPQQEPDRLMTA
jgi:chorismate lyase/3-hydroxybenzoate synthase